jgi:4'-phosphopantetheinyl transferase
MNAVDVHLWLSTLLVRPADVERDENVLDAQERALARRFLRDVPRRRFIAGRAALRRLLGRYLQIDPREVRLTSDSNGKPRLAITHARDLRFNVSHSEDAIACAIAHGREVGVDIERIRADLPVAAIAEQFFAPEEIAALRSLPPAAQVEAFFVCWTRKEAYVKAIGKGLGFGLDRFVVGIEPNGRFTLSSASPESGSNCWSIDSLNLPPGYVGAVAAEGTNWKLVRHIIG